MDLSQSNTFFKTQLAYDNWKSKYRYGEETPIQTFERVAKTLASVEKDSDYWYERFLKTLVRFDGDNPIGLKCTTGGRITANIGTQYKGATLINCYINGPVKDAKLSYTRSNAQGDISYPVEIITKNDPDDLCNIFLTILEQAKTLASEGGYGINFSFIRPRGSVIKGVGIKHPGVVSYMQIWDAVSECIVKGDADGYKDKIKNYLTEENADTLKKIMKKMARKGAMMGVLDISHPDIEEFIRAKQSSGKLTKFNLSVAINDEFMKAVESDDFYDLTFKEKIYKKIKARDLYNLIMESTYNRSEPGVLFIDNIHKVNPISYLGKCNATNPCIIGKSLLAVADKRGAVSIEQLAIDGKDVSLPSINLSTGKMEIKTGRNPRKTGEKKEIWKLVLDDESEFFATPDHNILKEDLVYCELKDLKVGDSILSSTFCKTQVEYNVKEKNRKVKSVAFFGNEDVYNITVDDNHNYFVVTSKKEFHGYKIQSGICVKNCGEIAGLGDLTTVCLLGSVNLTQYVSKDRKFDFDLYCEDIKTFSRMLDNVCDLTSNPLSSYQWAVENLRQFGMGINGLGSAIIMLGMKYNSAEAKDFVKKVCSIKEDLTWQTSAQLAKEKGKVALFDERFFKTDYFLSDRISRQTKEMIIENGVRNCKTTTYPPNGNSAILTDNVSNGIEPIFSLEYERTVIVSNWPEGLTKENVKTLLKHSKKKDYEYWRGEYNGKTYYYEPHNRGLCEISMVRDYGYQWILDNYPEDKNADYLITTSKLSAQDHLDIQALVQYYCNQSVSKTVNLPNDYDFENFKSLYIEGWKKGLCGLTTYREGSMESVIANVKKQKTQEIIKTDLKLPDKFINGPTSIIKREGKKFYIHFSYLPDDSEMKFPVCFWIYTNAPSRGQLKLCNKAAKELANLALSAGIDKKIVESCVEKAEDDEPHNKLGRMISLNLRHNVPLNKIYETLCYINGDNISTLLTAIRKFIATAIPDGTVISGYKCPGCKGENVAVEGGCKKCMDCGWNACGFISISCAIAISSIVTTATLILRYLF